MDKSVIQVHPETIIAGIMDICSEIEDSKQICDVLILSSKCFAGILIEDHARQEKCPHCGRCDKGQVELKLYENKAIAKIWTSFIWLDLINNAYEIKGYNHCSSELAIDYPDIYNSFNIDENENNF